MKTREKVLYCEHLRNEFTCQNCLSCKFSFHCIWHNYTYSFWKQTNLDKWMCAFLSVFNRMKQDCKWMPNSFSFLPNKHMKLNATQQLKTSLLTLPHRFWLQFLFFSLSFFFFLKDNGVFRCSSVSASTLFCVIIDIYKCSLHRYKE